MGGKEEYFDAVEEQKEALDDLNETEELRKRCLQEMRDWVKSQPHFINCRLDANFLLRFLRMRKYRVDLAQQVLDKYLTNKTKYPMTYQKLDIQKSSLRDLISRGYVFPLPERDKEGRVVLFCIAGALDSSRHKQSDVFKSFLLAFEVLMECELNQKRGISYIFTQEGYHISHALLVGLRDLQKMVNSGEKAIPLRHKQLHWMNVPKYLATLFQFLKTFLSHKLQERILLHTNVSSLHEYFPPSMLPKEYGGVIPVSQMTARWIEILDSKRDRILALDEMKVDERLRPKGKHSNHIIPRLMSNLSKLEIY
ncbi:alpha-tocopherol transfer protein-like [Parasteatoda tepidariorum]|uniref:alpha-tocopherol transfer protein-like n=1 Tax=Parasteatoda tepidariorum TaxID=114398 RepID=UPI00077FC7D2|nr:alpha-tocopherol transfer protein-like [Parasteatoda tepidariorum]XP_015930748.1 alpha-tocopherol transfer protein-like [Parasteatoda tepidariorum]XP_015930750.1 alpha-tocopherol transfer protein-like [Parasteatoda tepidariorum]